MGVGFEKHPPHIMPQGLGISCKPCLLFNIFSDDLCFDAFIHYRAILDLPCYGSDSWRSYILKGPCWCIKGEVAS